MFRSTITLAFVATIIILGDICCVTFAVAQDAGKAPPYYKVPQAQYDELQRRIVDLGAALTKTQAKVDKLEEENSKIKKGCDANSSH